jgi:hypothetical protein
MVHLFDQIGVCKVGATAMHIDYLLQFAIVLILIKPLITGSIF